MNYFLCTFNPVLTTTFLKKVFEKTLKKFLMENSFYSVDEFINSRV
jgi:hypothetical protein